MIDLPRNFLALTALFFAVLYAAPADAVTVPPLVIDQDMRSRDLAPHVEILRDPGAIHGIGDIITPAHGAQFLPPPRKDLNFGFISGAIWYRLKVVNPGAGPERMVLEIPFAHLEHVTLFQPTGGGQAEHHAGLMELPEKNGVVSQNPDLPVTVPPGETVLYLRVRTDTTFMTPLVLWRDTAYREHQKADWLFAGLNFGLLFAVFSYNLFIYFSLKDKSSFYYVFYLLAWIVENLVLNGFAHRFLWPGSDWWSQHSILFSAMLVEASGVAFTRVFLSSSVSSPRLDRALVLYLWACGGLAFLSLVWPVFTQVHLLLVCTALVYPPLVLAAGVIAFRKGLRSARFFLLAWISVIIGIMLYGLMHLGVLPHSFAIYHAMDIGAAVEAILMSIAIADKILEMRREKETAQLAALENERRVHQVLAQAKDELEVKVEIRTEALRREKERAEEATMLKNKFVSLVSHDLRSPLGSVMGLMGILEQKEKYKLDDAKQAEMVSRARKSIGGLVAMIDQLLDLSRLQSGRITVIKRPLPVRDLVATCFEHYQALADKKGITLVNGVEAEMKLFADNALFVEVVNNLVSNAVKFCSNGCAITVSASGPSSLTVKDTGTGIPGSILPHLFSAEVKTTTIGTDGEKGTGLGLPYCKEIMIAHGGDLSVESKQGEGTTFTLTLPSSRAVVLVADDQEVQRALVKKQLLAMRDIEVIEVTNGREALEMLKIVSVTLIITDLGMPEMDGFALLKEIRGNPLLNPLPVIVNSAASSSVGISGELVDNRRRAFEMGANDFIAKPLVPDDFIPRVLRYLG